MSIKKSNILFLNLYAFSLKGGVEKVAENFVYTLHQIYGFNGWKAYSLYDKNKDIETSYSQHNYRAFSGSKLRFILQSIVIAFRVKTIVFSHINLLIVGKLISYFNPKVRFILIAHGIEVWCNLPGWKKRFLKEHVEIWAVSRFTKNCMVNKHQINPNQITILNNCISPLLKMPVDFSKPQYLTNKYHIAKEVPVLYTLTRIASTEKYKGYDKVIAALAKLKTKGVKFIYLLAGKADEAEKLKIQQLIDANDLQCCVKLAGYVPDKEITDHFLLADVFVMPSKKEGFGIVFIEAAANGCQVIAGNKDGSVDALLDGKLGQLIDPDDVDAIATAIEKAIANKNHDPKLQQQLTVEHFGFETYKNKVAQLIAAT